MIRLFGTPHLDFEGRQRVGLPGKAFVLFALLVMDYPRLASRDQLALRLWEDAPGDNPSVSLRGLLARVRRWEEKHGLRLLDLTKGTVALLRETDVDFVRSIPSVSTIDDWTRTSSAYSGALLSGLESGAGAELSTWIVSRREELAMRYRTLSLEAAEGIQGEEGETILRRLFDDHPEDERISRALLLRTHRDHGPDRTRQQYRQLSERLDRELGARPSRQTEELMAQLAPSHPPVAVVDRLPIEPGPTQALQLRGIPRIALLPPTTPLGAPPRALTLATALVEDVVLALCRMRSFAMYAPHTMRLLRGNDQVAAVAPLQANYVGSTRLLPHGDRYRLAISLTHIDTSAILMGEQFEFDEALLHLQLGEIADVVARQLVGAVEASEISLMHQDGSASAYVHVLLGARDIQSVDLRALRRAKGHYRKALQLHPDYVPAMTGIARCLSKEGVARRELDAASAREANVIADRASRIDPSNPETWRERAQANLYLRELDTSLEFIEEAAKRGRHHADILAEKADILVHLSRTSEALKTIEAAMELNPMSPEDYHWIKGSAHFFLGQDGAAIAELKKHGQPLGVSRLMAAAAGMAGDLELARVCRQRWLRVHPDTTVADMLKFFPIREKADGERFAEGMRRAGFD